MAAPRLDSSAADRGRRRPLVARALPLLSAVLLAGYLVVWLGMGHAQIVNADFPTLRAGAALLRDGHARAMYEPAIAQAQYQVEIGGAHQGNLPFEHAPLAAAMLVPFTVGSLDQGFHLWGLTSLLLTVAACALVAWVAPWPAGTGSGPRVAATVVAVAGFSTVETLRVGQDVAVLALGVAAAYWAWRRGHRAGGGFLLALLACVAKPHLAVGVGAWMLGRRDPRALAGAVAGVAVAVAASVAIVGVDGCLQFVATALRFGDHPSPQEMFGIHGLLARWLGTGALEATLAWTCSGVAVAAAAFLGDRARRCPAALESTFTAATLLSLLAAPHVLGHDLLAVTGLVVACTARATASGLRSAPVAVMAAWLTLSLGEALDTLDVIPTRAGRVTPLIAIALVVVLVLHPTLARGSPAPRVAVAAV